MKKRLMLPTQRILWFERFSEQPAIINRLLCVMDTQCVLDEVANKSVCHVAIALQAVQFASLVCPNLKALSRPHCLLLLHAAAPKSSC